MSPPGDNGTATFGAVGTTNPAGTRLTFAAFPENSDTQSPPAHVRDGQLMFATAADIAGRRRHRGAGCPVQPIPAIASSTAHTAAVSSDAWPVAIAAA